MKLTVIGMNGPFPQAGGACSSYLISQGETHVLVDCGCGALSQLQKVLQIEKLSALVLSHLHSDHCSDALVLRYAMQKLGMKKLPLYAPQAPTDVLEGLLSGDAFEYTPIEEGLKAKIGELEFTFTQGKHPVPSFAMRVEGDGVMGYTGDTVYLDKLPEFFSGVQLLLADAGLLEREVSAAAPHMSVREAALLGKESAAKTTVLTHFSPLTRMEEIKQEADSAMEGCILAKPLQSFELG